MLTALPTGCSPCGAVGNSSLLSGHASTVFEVLSLYLKKKKKSFLIKMLLQENLLRTGKGKTFQWFLDALEAHCELQLRHQDPRSCPLQGQSPAEGQKCLVVRAGGSFSPRCRLPAQGVPLRVSAAGAS